MIVKENHYYKFTNCHGVEFIFQAKSKEDKGWIIDVIRSSSLDYERTNSFYVTTSDNEAPERDRLKELSNAEILAIKI